MRGFGLLFPVLFVIALLMWLAAEGGQAGGGQIIAGPAMVAAIGAAQSMAFALGAVLLWWLVLRWLDYRAGVRSFGEVFNVLKSDPRALARYLGMRNLAVALLVGFVLATVRF